MCLSPRAVLGGNLITEMMHNDKAKPQFDVTTVTSKGVTNPHHQDYFGELQVVEINQQ